jgi:hypothetical protein
MRISLYIEHNDLDDFCKWVNRLSHGHIETAPVRFSHKRLATFQDPLEIQLEANEYAVICDATEEAEKIAEMVGPMDIQFSPVDVDWQMSTIRSVMKNADRHNISTEVIYTSLRTMSELPTITPAEAMIMAEGEWIK